MKKQKPHLKKRTPIIYEKKIEGPRIIKAEYVASAVSSGQYPEGDTIEIAFLGRSNAGKSSLINSLCNHRGLALVSKEPGKTKTINFFSVESKEELDEDREIRYNWFLVDLPGYGYAKTGEGNKGRKLWSSFIADYILSSERLMLLCLLIDGRHPELEIDMEAYNWLMNAQIPLQIIVTKTDKMTTSECSKNLKLIESRYATASPIIAYSSLKHRGRSQLINRINLVVTGERV